MADGSRSAASLVLDGSQCPLAKLLAKWGTSEHGERSFQRLLGYVKQNPQALWILLNLCIQILRFVWASLWSIRWCAKYCDIQPGTIRLTKKVGTSTGGTVIEATEHAVLWPWDILHHLWSTGKLLEWIYDPECMASAKVHAASLINLQSI